MAKAQETEVLGENPRDSNSKIYTNVKWLDENHKFLDDLAEFCKTTGHRQKVSRYDYKTHKYIKLDNTYEHRNEFLYRFCSTLRTKRNAIVNRKGIGKDEKTRLAIANLRLGYYYNNSWYKRLEGGSYSPAIIVLICETLGLEYEFIHGDINSRYGAIEVIWKKTKNTPKA